MSQFITGSYTGTGAAVNISLGFTPVRVEVVNATDGDESFTWQDGMTAAHAIKIASDGAQSRITSNGISLYTGSNTPGSEAAEGFTAGSALSESTKVFRYIAYGE